MSTDQKWAIVTGGSRGLGYETAKGLIESGIFVYLIGKDASRVKESAQKLGCQYRAVDVADSEKCLKLYEQQMKSGEEFYRLT
jgi:NADP-dependent 3-hydroxy acid dehydrogenase YdfG